MALSRNAAFGKDNAQNVPHGDGLVQDFHLFPRNITTIISLSRKKNKIFENIFYKIPNLFDFFDTIYMNAQALLLKIKAQNSTNGMLTPLCFFAIMVLSENMGSTTVFSR